MCQTLTGLFESNYFPFAAIELHPKVFRVLKGIKKKEKQNHKTVQLVSEK